MFEVAYVRYLLKLLFKSKGKINKYGCEIRLKVIGFLRKTLAKRMACIFVTKTIDYD